MNPCELTAVVTAVANSISKRLTVAELSLVASLFVQLGDTLATLAAAAALCEEKSGGGEE